MPTFGPYQFTTATDVGDNTHTWENVDNAVDSENISTASSFTESSAEDEFTDLDTNTLRLSGFTPPPAYATIDGVSVSIRIANAQTGAVWAVQCRRSSDGATSATKTYTNNTSGGHTVTLGSPTDAWGNEFGVGDAPSEFDQIDIVCTDTAEALQLSLRDHHRAYSWICRFHPESGQGRRTGSPRQFRIWPGLDGASL